MTTVQSTLDPKNSTFPTSSGDGYEFFDPLFNAFGADGCESTSDIIFGMLYVVSFVVVLALAIAAWALVSGLRRMDRL